jgi:hypothetical protein
MGPSTKKTSHYPLIQRGILKVGMKFCNEIDPIVRGCLLLHQCCSNEHVSKSGKI